MERRGAFDYILLETSGLADPGNIAPLFWVDDGLGSSIYLDGIITIVDTQNILRSLNEKLEDETSSTPESAQVHLVPTTTAHLQISYADVIILNKRDTLSHEQIAAVRDTIQNINGLAKVHYTEYSRLPQLEGVVLDLHAYDGVDSLDTSRNSHSHIDPVSMRFRSALAISHVASQEKHVEPILSLALLVNFHRLHYPASTHPRTVLEARAVVEIRAMGIYTRPSRPDAHRPV